MVLGDGGNLDNVGLFALLQVYGIHSCEEWSKMGVFTACEN
jgi:hypothetical protein